jgi:hypothetical protein
MLRDTSPRYKFRRALMPEVVTSECLHGQPASLPLVRCSFFGRCCARDVVKHLGKAGLNNPRCGSGSGPLLAHQSRKWRPPAPALRPPRTFFCDVCGTSQTPWNAPVSPLSIGCTLEQRRVRDSLRRAMLVRPLALTFPLCIMKRMHMLKRCIFCWCFGCVTICRRMWKGRGGRGPPQPVGVGSGPPPSHNPTRVVGGLTVFL